MEEIASYLADSGIIEGDDVFRSIAKVFERTDREKDGRAGQVLSEASRAAGELIENSKQRG